MRQLALTALTILSLCVTAQAVTLDDVPYNTPMWSDNDPFGFGIMNVVTADVGKIKGDIVVITNDMDKVKGDIVVITNDMDKVKGDIVVITNDVELLKLYGPSIDGLEGRTGAVEGRTNAWNTAVEATLNYGPRITGLEGRTNSWNTAFGWGNHLDAGYVRKGFANEVTEDFRLTKGDDFRFSSLIFSMGEQHGYDYWKGVFTPYRLIFSRKIGNTIFQSAEYNYNQIITYTEVLGEQTAGGEYSLPTGPDSQIATLHDIATAVAGLDPEEHDLKALRLYHYGSTDIVESPAEWFTFAGGVITGFDYQAGREHVVIPWEINGQAVVGIGDRSFFHEHTGSPITVVKAPQTVVGVDNFAFEQCTALTSVNIPQATTIGDLVFQQCTALTSVNIPQATTIGEAAFYGCTALTSINLPQATSIAPIVFQGCFSLTKLIIGSDSKPTFVEGWNNNTYPDLKIYVTNPYATGWDGITEVNGTPVVRIVNTEMLEDLIPDVDAAIGTATNAVVTALTSPYQPWTATITPVSGTATITRAHGLYPKLVLTGKTTISIDSATYPTEGTSAVKLSLFAGANEVELDETNVMYAEPIEISDTEWTTVYFERTGNSAWRAVTW